MSKFFICFLFSFFSFSIFAQNTITIKGKIIDENSKLPIESATVYISTVKDSTVIDYTITDKNGAFKMDTKKINKPFFLKISYLGYQIGRAHV